MTSNLPGNDGAGSFDIDIAKLKEMLRNFFFSQNACKYCQITEHFRQQYKAFKDIPESIIKYMTPQAKHALMEAALKEEKAEIDVRYKEYIFLQSLFPRQTWTKPLARIVEDNQIVAELEQNQHAWAFPEFVERGGAMQDEETFQCWAVSENSSFHQNSQFKFSIKILN